MPNLNPNPITPEMFLMIYLALTVKDAAALILPVLPEVLLREAQLRATNIAIQYGGLASALAAETEIFDPRSPIKLVQYGINNLQMASSIEEATGQGLITLGALFLTVASTSDAGASFAWVAFLAVFATKVAGFQSILFADSLQGTLTVFIHTVKLYCKLVKLVSQEIAIEIERRKYNLPRKLPKFKISKRSLFRRGKRKPQDLIMRIPRIKKRTFNIRSCRFSLYLPYAKKIVVKSTGMVSENHSSVNKSIPMVKFIPVK